MKKIRAKAVHLHSSNNLKMNLIPFTHQIAFREYSEDVVVMNRVPEKSKGLLAKRRMVQMVKDREFHLQAQLMLTKRLKKINEETGMQEINLQLELDDGPNGAGQEKSRKESQQNNPEVDAVGEEAKVHTRKTRSVINSSQKARKDEAS